ncbi:acyl-CoA dehydrogenase family protein [Cupriavidus sp. CV2]|uniref:acyl-CoA dehydrogenase family protein n=1 Tax=Cupriavidus ulmosensis TaxID=3065913 RepID=UPI00296B1995|nr:acyl-CoA dehydrogenase family protein [Cupriavidus sp. CV2]MDW3681063.1 acyl-CoA dehydrogenase family protein [Cupriavidus sp. CV2]
MPHNSRTDPLERFRIEVRDFLRDAVPADIRAATRAHCLVTREQAVRWQRILHARGWAAPGWPREHGGPGWSLMEQAIFREELAASDAPCYDNLGIDTIGPTLIRYGTPEQCQRWLPGMLSFDDFWAQGYSEPDAGSDLASLRTVARRDGDAWIVNGSKIWQSLGQWANWALVLVRTDPAAPRKQEGISVLLMDLRAPGVTVRPIRFINGSHFHVQMFFDDVRVPAANLVGTEHAGWSIAKGLLVIERLFVARVGDCKAELASVAALASRQGSGPPPQIEDPLLARRHAELDIRMRALEAAWWPAVRFAEQGGSPELEASLLKLDGNLLLQDLHLFRMDALGCDALPFDPLAIDGKPNAEPLSSTYSENFPLHFWRYRGITLAGGSSEIQRQIIAKAIFSGQTEIDRPRDDHLDEQQAVMSASLRRWLDKHYGFERRREIVGAHDGFDMPGWNALAGLGLAGLLVPEQDGGLGGAVPDLMPLMEALGEVLVVEPVLWSAVLGTQILLSVKACEPSDRRLAALASGEARCALAHGEGYSHHDSHQATVVARQEGTRWRLSGTHRLVMGGGQAQHIFVAASLAGGGLALFDVPGDAVGTGMRIYQLHDGRSAADLRLDGVELPAAALLAGPGCAEALLDDALALATVALCAESVGVMRRSLAITVEYMRTRKQFGRTLSEQQALQHRVVDLYRAWSAARHLVAEAVAGWSTVPPSERSRRVSAAKYMVGHAGRAIALDALQLHGAVGLQDETPISHYSKRLMANDALLGNAATHLGRFVAAGRQPGA